MRRLSIVVVALLTTVLAASPALALDEVNTKRLRNAVTVGGILSHERVFQRIANQHGGTRASGTEGYDASADYVAERLEAAGYEVTTQDFEFPFFQEVTPAELEQVSPTPTTYETGTFDYSGSGEVEGQVFTTNDNVIPPTPVSSSTAGCEPEDFAPAPAGPAIALVQRGGCDFSVKATNAQAAGYDAVIIFNEGNPGRTDLFIGTLGSPFTIPVVGLSFADASALITQLEAGQTVVARVFTETTNEVRTTSNVLADSPTGSADRVVVVGAHLDSVIAGPGINDNGSGSSTILEIAEEMAELGIRNRQKLRFAFWGAEESNLLGSDHYVNTLSNAELGTIKANLNFDMLGSTNYVRFVYDGDGGGDPDAAGPPGSAQIEAVFTNYFASQGLASEPTPFDGRSDYGPFIAVGIPAGGLFSGAEGEKTPEQAAIYGGTAGEPYDPCYHEACDDINNLSTKALFEMGDAAAHATMTLARSRTGFFEDGSFRAGARAGLSAERSFSSQAAA